MRPSTRGLILALVTVVPAQLSVAQQEHVDPPGGAGFSGAWAGRAYHDGDSAVVALEIEPGGDDSVALRLSIPTIHMQRTSLGTVSVTVDGDSVVLGPFALEYERNSQSLRGVLPRALVPVYDIPIVLRRVERLTLPQRVALDAPVKVPAWVYDGGAPMWAGPVYGDGAVYAGDDDGYLHALEARSGTKRWSSRVGAPIRSRVTVADGAVFFQADDGYLYRLSRASGEVTWRRRLLDSAFTRIPLDDPRSRWDPFASAVTAGDGRLFLGTADGRVLAITSTSGDALWTFRAHDAIVAAPAVADGTVFVGSFDHHVYALDASTGAVRWKHDTGAPVVSTPAVATGRVVIGSRSYELLALDSETGTAIWSHYVWFSWIESSVTVRDGIGYVGSSDANVVLAFDPTTGRESWRTDVFGWAWGRPAVVNARTYVATSGNSSYSAAHRASVVALDRTTGRPVWQFVANTDDLPGVFGFPGTLAVGEGLVFAAGLDGRVYALRQ